MLTTREVINLIFRDPAVLYSLSEFDDLKGPVDDILNISKQTLTSGKNAGKSAYFLDAVIPTRTGREKYQVLLEGGPGKPEEIVRQLWIYKLVHVYGYDPAQIATEVPIYFGTELHAKAADIVVYDRAGSDSSKIIIECKEPRSSEGIEQLKSYMNSKGAPVAVWSNGASRVILHRSAAENFIDTLPEVPRNDQSPEDVLRAGLKLDDLEEHFNFKQVIQDLEELVLADSGADEFNEIFKLIFAKIWDEKSAARTPNRETRFRKATDPADTYKSIDRLFSEARAEWPGIFDDDYSIELAPRHLHICIGPIEKLRLLGSNLRIMDDAFEYLLPAEAKKKKGQFFTPRPVIEMCVRMLNPKIDEYVIDPSCGSGGFLLHAMEWAYPAKTDTELSQRRGDYAERYLWGIDFEKRAAKTSRALMLIAGDGHSNIFGPDVNSLDPRSWYENASGRELISKLLRRGLSGSRPTPGETFTDREKAWDFFSELKFDLVLANPPFAGEIKDATTLSHYSLAGPAISRAKGNKQAKEERDVLFLERIMRMLKPGGRAAVILPQGKFNNSSLSFIRNWVFEQARVLAVVGLHQNTFKPHTGQKTSVLFFQKYSEDERRRITNARDEVAGQLPDVRTLLQEAIGALDENEDLRPDSVPPAVFEVFEAGCPEPIDLTAYSDEEGDAPTLSDLKSRTQAHVAEVRRTESDSVALLESATEALELALTADINGADTAEHRELLRSLRASKKSAEKSHRDLLKTNAKRLAQPIATLDAIAATEARESLRAQAEFILASEDLVSKVTAAWIKEAALERIDYPVFMAVSKRGGKDNSGNYVLSYPASEVANRDSAGNSVIDQDLVNFDISKKHLANIERVPNNELMIAEQFVKFAKANGLDFWREG